MKRCNSRHRLCPQQGSERGGLLPHGDHPVHALVLEQLPVEHGVEHPPVEESMGQASAQPLWGHGGGGESPMAHGAPGCMVMLGRESLLLALPLFMLSRFWRKPRRSSTSGSERHCLGFFIPGRGWVQATPTPSTWDSTGSQPPSQPALAMPLSYLRMSLKMILKPLDQLQKVTHPNS